MANWYLKNMYLIKLHSLLWCSLHWRNSNSNFFSSVLATTRALRVWWKNKGTRIRYWVRIIMRDHIWGFTNEDEKTYTYNKQQTRSLLLFSAICSRSCSLSLSLSSRARCSAWKIFKVYMFYKTISLLNSRWEPSKIILSSSSVMVWLL